jgi:hypothetical protein
LGNNGVLEGGSWGDGVKWDEEEKRFDENEVAQEGKEKTSCWLLYLKEKENRSMKKKKKK